VRGESLVEPVDYEALLALAPELIHRWAELRFDDGAVVVDSPNERREGLRVLEGDHPKAGTVYRVVVSGSVAPELSAAERAGLAKLGPAGSDRDAASGRMETRTATFTVEVLANDAELLQVRVLSREKNQVDLDITVTRPQAPRTAAFALDGRLGGNWLNRGRVIGDGLLSIDHLPPRESGAPQLHAAFRHPKWRGAASVRADPTNDGRWRVVFDVRARGAGLLRPVVAIASPGLSRVVRRRFGMAMSELPHQVEEFNRRWQGDLAQHGARGLAQQAIDSFLHAVAM